jgi:hypothetical protein
MTTLQQNATTIEIKGASYTVELIPAGEFGLAACRITKLVNGETYDVIRQHDGLVTCSCPDFVCRHESKGTVCKHGAAMVARGFLAAPCPVPNRPAVAPVTLLDLKRAAMWGLKLPTAPVAVQVAPTSDVIPHGEQHLPIAVAVEVAPIVEPATDDEAGSWDDDDARWELGPEPDFVSPGVTPGSPADEWSMGETVALLLTSSAIEDGDDNAFYKLDEEYRDDFFHFLISLGGPAATWSSWLTLCRCGSPVSFPGPAKAEEARPTYQGRVRPTEVDEQIAAILFRDDRPGAYFVVGQPMPPIGDKSFVRKSARPYTGTGMTDQDIYRAGAVS